MNYQFIYDEIISKRQQELLEGYGEKHHILPKSLGGSNHKSNIVKLTCREHFIAHRLLAKIHGGKMWYALIIMAQEKSKSAKGVIITSRTYEVIRKNNAIVRSKLMSGKGNHFYGKELSYESRLKMRGKRIASTGKNNSQYGLKQEPERKFISNYVRTYTSKPISIDYTVMNTIHKTLGINKTTPNSNRLNKTDKQLQLIRYFRGVMIGKIHSEKDTTGVNNPNYGNGKAITGDKNHMYGKQQKQSTKDKIGAKAKRRIQCPHCGIDGNIANIHRWHLDNCRHKIAN